MALTGSFLADFTSFYDAAQQADVHLRGMETGANKVEASLNKMVDSFSGRKLAQDATLMVEAIERMGGATALTEAEQAKVNRTVTEAIAKYKALGMEAPPELLKVEAATRGAGKSTSEWSGALSTMTGVLGAMGVQLSVGALVAWVGNVADAAGHIGDLSQQLGVSTDAVQRWGYAAKMGGATIDDVEKSITFMNKALSGGEDSTKAALERVGLSFEAVRTMGTERAFEAITEGLRTIPDPALRTRTEMELLGKAGIALGAAIDDGMKGVGDSANVMSRETIRALKDAGDAWESYKDRLIIASAEGIDGILHLGDRVKEGLGTAVRFSTDMWTSGLSGAVALHNAAAAKIVDDINTVHAAEDAAAADAARRNAEAAARIEQDEARRKKALDEAETIRKKAAADAERDAKALADLQDRLFGRDLIQKAGDYAKALGGVENVSKMTATAQEGMNKVLGDALTALAAAGQGASTAAGEYRKLYLATLDYQKLGADMLKNNPLPGRGITQTLDPSTANIPSFETAEQAAASAEAINAKMLADIAVVDKAMGRIPQAAKDAADAATAALGTIPEEGAKSAGQTEQAFSIAFNAIGTQADTLADRVAKVWGRHAMDAEYAKNHVTSAPSLGTMNYNLDEERRAGLTIGPNQTTWWPQLAEGGVGNFGSGTPAMLHGQEAIIPLDKLGGGGLGAVNVAININGHLDPARAGRDAAESLVAYMKSRGVRI